METKSVVKVGVFVLFAALLFAGGYAYLSHIKINKYRVRVTFADAKGLVSQSAVRMQGVSIGEVEKVDLDTSSAPPHPVVLLAIDNKYDIPADSQIRIVSGILITNPQVEITPGKLAKLPKDDSAQVAGAASGGPLEALSPELAQTVQNVNKSFEKIQQKFEVASGKIDKILDQTQVLLKNSNQTIVYAKDALGDPRIKSKLLATLDNFQQASGEARKGAGELRNKLNTMLASGKGTFDEVKDQVLNIFDRIDSTLDEANSVVKKLTEQVTDPRLQQSLQETVELARTTLARFNQIASDLHQFTGDPQLQSDIKQTIANLKNATAKGEEAVGKVNNLLGTVSGPEGRLHLPRLPKVDLTANFSQQADPDRFRFDVEARVGFGSSLLNLGAYDVGQDTRLILQGGNRLSDALTARYGLYASRLGIGADWTLGPSNQIRADLYDSNRPRLDLRSLFRVNKNASVWIGADGLFRRPVPRIGIQLTR